MNAVSIVFANDDIRGLILEKRFQQMYKDVIYDIFVNKIIYRNNLNYITVLNQIQ
jgi:hypothetical protein